MRSGATWFGLSITMIRSGSRRGASEMERLDDQVIGAVGFLLCGLGTACIYYGTEQGFSGQGGDNQMREAMFDKSTPRQESPEYRMRHLPGDRKDRASHANQ